MRPTGAEAIRGIQGALMAALAPELQTLFAQDTAQTMQMLLESLAGEWDSAAEDLRADNRRLQELLTRAADASPPPAADAEMAAVTAEVRALAAEPAEESLALSKLRARNDRLRGLLERLLVALEDGAGEPAWERLMPLRAELYAHLREVAARGWSVWDALSFRERMARLRSARPDVTA